VKKRVLRASPIVPASEGKRNKAALAKAASRTQKAALLKGRLCECDLFLIAGTGNHLKLLIEAKA
jgi:hypothetical protein